MFENSQSSRAGPLNLCWRTHAHTHAHTPMHTHSQGLSPESFWPVILATALAVWQAPGKDGEKHQGLAPNFAILGVQVEMHLQCLH